MFRILVLVVLFSATSATFSQTKPATENAALDIDAARKIMVRHTLLKVGKDCGVIIDARRENETFTIANCLSKDGKTILRYRIDMKASTAELQPAS